jgi:hypothetical protein
MRFTSQTDRGHDGTLDELTIRSVDLIQVGGSDRLSGRGSTVLEIRV